MAPLLVLRGVGMGAVRRHALFVYDPGPEVARSVPVWVVAASSLHVYAGCP